MGAKMVPYAVLSDFKAFFVQILDCYKYWSTLSKGWLAGNRRFVFITMQVKINAFTWMVAGLLISAFTGCGRDDVRTYRVPKETTPQVAAADLPSGHPTISGSGAAPATAAKVPADWQEAPPGEMRVASYRVTGKDGKMADVSVIPLPGGAGGDINNVNRWRGQVGLAPVSDAEFAKLGESVQVGGQEGKLYEMAGQNSGSGEKNRILAAIVRRPDAAWFFKMVGDDALVAEQKTAFVEYLKSFSFGAPGGGGGLSQDAQLPPSHPPIGNITPAAIASAPTSSEGKPEWQVPAGWKEIDGGQFLVAKFIIGGSDNSQAAVNVSMSAGDGGGVLGNVNRWRGQLGLNQQSQSEVDKSVTSVDIDGGKAMLVDMSGNDMKSGAKTRLIGAIVSKGQQTWFYKLMGPASLVEQQKDAFTKFVQGAKYR